MWTHDEQYDDLDFDNPAVQRAYAAQGTLLDQAVATGYVPTPVHDGSATRAWDAECAATDTGFDLAGYVNGKFDRGEWT